jgi:hypothetical protein
VQVDPAKDKLEVEGKRVVVAAEARHFYFVVNKPKVITVGPDTTGKRCATHNAMQRRLSV